MDLKNNNADRKRFFSRIAVLVIITFVLNTLSHWFKWYFTLWFFDMFMHFLSGFWLGLLLIWFLRTNEENMCRNMILTMVAILIIGISWEVYEFIVINHWAGYPFNFLDTTSDVFFDISGGLLATYYYMRKVWYNQNYAK
jgi:hypothetical protein